MWISCEDMFWEATRGYYSKFWSKKPETDWGPDLTNDECFDMVRDAVINSPLDTSIFNRRTSYEKDSKPYQQGMWANRLLHELSRRKEQVDWMCVLDVDEYIVSPQVPLKSVLAEQEEDVALLRMGPKIFKNRFRSGNAIPVATIGENYGMFKIKGRYFNPKYLFRPHLVPKFQNVHITKRHKGRKLFADPFRLRFHHFRGCPAHEGTRLENVHNEMLVYTRALKDRPLKKIDYTHNL